MANKWEAQLRKFALAYPGAREEFPWGDRVVKVGQKVFLFMSKGSDELSLSAKLPLSHGVALMLPFADPTGYGLGRSGWVSASFGPGEEPPMQMLFAWIDESYRAVAPKKLVEKAPRFEYKPPAARAPRKPARRRK